MDEQLRLNRIPLGWKMLTSRGGYVEAARSLNRDADLVLKWASERSAAVQAFELSMPEREMYLQQVHRSQSALSALGEPELQSVVVRPDVRRAVPLIDQSWLKTKTLDEAASVAAQRLLWRLDLPSSGAVDALREPETGPVGRMAETQSGLMIFAGDGKQVASLAIMLHEMGHYLYETFMGAEAAGTVWRCVGSEGAALSLATLGVAEYLHGDDDRRGDASSWESYCRSEHWLIHYYFLLEASELGLCEIPAGDLCMPYLRETYLHSVGYQYVYARAASETAGREAVVLRQLSQRLNGSTRQASTEPMHDLTAQY